MEQYILSIDAGTTSARCIIFDKQGNVRAMKQRELHMVYPHDGWVEQSAREIWEVQRTVCQEAIAALAIRPEQIAAIGITNQRETTIVWDKQTGEPIAPAIVWQCRRTASMAEDLRTRGLEPYIRKTTGLLVDAYFSATKISWILDHVTGARHRAKRGKLLFGTVDSWLIWNLTGGKRHVTDVTNAARTMLFDIHAHKWDAAICRELDIPMELLPEVVPSSGVLGETEAQLFGTPIPIAGVAGDQQSALFGQTCFEPGNAKNTYGTGCFLLMNTGDKPVESHNGLLTTVAWEIDGKITYALEGSVFVAGAAIQWLRDEMGLVKQSADTQALAQSVQDTGGVYFVPAFTGLGAPYWDPYARGMLIGLTRSTSRAQVVRAVLESLAYQTADVLRAMQHIRRYCPANAACGRRRERQRLFDAVSVGSLPCARDATRLRRDNRNGRCISGGIGGWILGGFFGRQTHRGSVPHIPAANGQRTAHEEAGGLGKSRVALQRLGISIISYTRKDG